MTSPAEARQIETHLAGCASCRQALRWMQATRRAVSQRPAALPPADLRASVLRAIAASEAPPAMLARRPLILRPAFAAGMLALVAAAFTGHSLLTRPAVPVSVVPVPVAIVVLPRVVVRHSHTTPPILTAARPAAGKDETLPVRSPQKSRPRLALLARQPAPEPTPVPNVPRLPLPPAPRTAAPRLMPRIARSLPIPLPLPVKQAAPPVREAALPPASPAPAPAASDTSAPVLETHSAPVTLVASNSVHDDGLSSVRLLATSLQKSGLARQSSRDGSVSAHTASYTALADEGKFVQVDMVHTP